MFRDRKEDHDMTSRPDACDGLPECDIASEELVAEVQGLVKQGNIRGLAIKSPRGRTLIEIPLRLGIRGTPLEPIWAALRGLSGVSKNFAVAVQREEAWPRDDIAERRP